VVTHVANRVSLIAGLDFSLEIKQCIVTRPDSCLWLLDPNCLPCRTEAIQPINLLNLLP